MCGTATENAETEVISEKHEETNEVTHEEMHEITHEEMREEMREDIHEEKHEETYDNQNVTLVANKWLPDDHEALKEPEAGGSKKSKKPLIITLSAIVLVIGALVGLAFIISGKYSKKVEELGTYQNSPLIGEMKSEYSELFSRAQACEGVFHVFETFSIGGEIDEFLERIKLIEEGLPEKAIDAKNKLDGLGKTYYIDDWAAKIEKCKDDIGSLIEKKEYESLIETIHSCKNLEKEIVDGNIAYIDKLESVKNELTDMRTTFSAYALYREEADKYLEDANKAITQAKYKEIPGFVDRGMSLIDTVKEANRPYEEIEDRKKYYDNLFSVVEVKDTERYNSILVNYSDALIGGSEASVLSDIVSEYALLYEETHEENVNEYLALREKIESFDTVELTPEELTEYTQAYEKMKVGETEDKLSNALSGARECMAYIEKYTQKITESTKFLELITTLPAMEVVFEKYDQVLSEEELYYICSFLLTDERIADMRETLGWGSEAQQGEIAGWRCGFSREECEELAYYITGNKHYFYKEISAYAVDYDKYSNGKNVGVVRKSDFEVIENEDETINISFVAQIKAEGYIYNADISVVAAYNEDSYFDKYSVIRMEIGEVREINYGEVFLNALKKLHDKEPDEYGSDMLLSRRMSLVYIDDDYVPELYINSIYGASSAYLVTYADKDDYCVTLLESGNGFSEYIADEGVIRICDGHMGYYSDSVLEIKKNGEVRTLFAGNYYYVADYVTDTDIVKADEDEDPDEVKYNITYPESIEDVDKKDYYDYLDECYTLRGESHNLTVDYTYDEMIKLLSDSVIY